MKTMLDVTDIKIAGYSIYELLDAVAFAKRYGWDIKKQDEAGLASRTPHKWPDDETIVDAANFHDHKCDSYSFIKGVQWLKSFVERGSYE